MSWIMYGSHPERRDKNGLTEAEFLEQYRPGDYVRPSVATDMVIFTVSDEAEENYRKLPERSLRLLLIQRGGHPYLGDWALPGGFVRPNETTQTAAKRELREETGLDQVYLEQLYTFSDPGRDPRTWVMSCSYMALIDGTKIRLEAGDDADNAQWFKVSLNVLNERVEYNRDAGFGQVKWVRTRQLELTLTCGELKMRCVLEKQIKKSEYEESAEYRICENGGLAFDHAKIIVCALERLRGKLEYTDLALHLMPETFTLTQLQQVYEAILGKSLLKAAFRRKVAALVEETDSYTRNEGHRPSRLYRRKWEE